ncbi:MAG: hypothetical protein WB949_13320 [Candidatus Acidiferrales bacterium]
MKGKSDRLAQKAVAAVLAGFCTLAAPVRAEDLKPETVEVFDRYVQLTEAQIDAQLARREPYLWIEGLPQGRRADAEARLRAGEVVIERLETLNASDHGRPTSVENGMIHHWIGTVFIPGATLAQTLALEEDYDHHQDFFRPDVMRSKILRHDGNDFTIELRLYKKKVITTVLDTEHEVHYTFVDSTHAWSRSRTTRIQEVDNADEKDERLEPAGHDRGFLWRMNTYWRFEKKDGGTYVECQSISLTRDIPAGLGWLIGPYVTSVPRESLTFTLATTRSAVLNRIATHAAE